MSGENCMCPLPEADQHTDVCHICWTIEYTNKQKRFQSYLQSDRPLLKSVIPNTYCQVRSPFTFRMHQYHGILHFARRFPIYLTFGSYCVCMLSRASNKLALLLEFTYTNTTSLSPIHIIFLHRKLNNNNYKNALKLHFRQMMHSVHCTIGSTSSRWLCLDRFLCWI